MATHIFHDNEPAHRAFATQEFLEGIEVQLLEHPAYSPDLAPRDFDFSAPTSNWG